MSTTIAGDEQSQLFTRKGFPVIRVIRVELSDEGSSFINQCVRPGSTWQICISDRNPRLLGFVTGDMVNTSDCGLVAIEDCDTESRTLFSHTIAEVETIPMTEAVTFRWDNELRVEAESSKLRINYKWITAAVMAVAYRVQPFREKCKADSSARVSHAQDEKLVLGSESQAGL